jgi:hypothetical protein
MLYRVVDWSKRKIVRPLQAMSRWEQIATLVVGILGGLFPVPALTSLITLALCAMLRFAPAQSGVATALNLSLAVAELALIPVFAQIGAVMTGVDSDNFTGAVIVASMQEGIGALLTNASSMLAHACLSWTVLAAVGMACLMVTKTTKRAEVLPLR